MRPAVRNSITQETRATPRLPTCPSTIPPKPAPPQPPPPPAAPPSSWECPSNMTTIFNFSREAKSQGRSLPQRAAAPRRARGGRLNDQEFLPERTRTGSGTTRRFSRSRMTSEPAYRGFSASIALNSLIKSSGSFWGSRSHTTPNTSPLHISEKSVSFVTTMRFSAHETVASVLSPLDLLASVKSMPRSESSFASSIRTFSSSRDRIGVDDDIVVSGQRTGVIQGCSDLFSSERSEEGVSDTLKALALCKHLQDLPDHDARALKCRLAVANVGVGNNVLIDDDAFVHNADSVAQGAGKNQWRHVWANDTCTYAAFARLFPKTRMIDDLHAIAPVPSPHSRI